ncbi:MAG TPA: hypothetical protein VFV41_11435, partial [Streptosporangiaceae bacterium]|nr:hypothetical protein [Streptosporangiaceae bacterium]
PTRTIRQVLPCAAGASQLRPCPGVLDALREQLASLDRRADDLARARAILTQTIDRTARQPDPIPAGQPSRQPRT